MTISDFDHVGMVNGQSSNNVVNFINNNYNHRHQQLFINFPVAVSTFMIHHDIFAFTIPTAMTLVQMKFPDEHLFHTHPLLMMLTLCSIIIYSLAFSLELLVLRVSGTRHDDVCLRNWSIVSGSLCLASLLGVLFSPRSSSWLWLPMLLCFLLLTLLAFAPKLVALVSDLLSWFHQGGLNHLCRTSSPLLPLSIIEFSSRL